MRFRSFANRVATVCIVLNVACTSEAGSEDKRPDGASVGGSRATPARGGAAGSPSSGGSKTDSGGGGAGGSEATGGVGAVAGTSQNTGATGGSPKVPSESISGAVASLGTPWDVRDDRSSPSDGISGEEPKIVSVANRDGSLDVAWLDTTQPQIYITHVAKNSDSYRASWHLKVHTLELLAGFARDDAGAIYYVTTVAEDLLQNSELKGIQRPNIAHLLKLDPDGHEVFRTDLRTDVTRDDVTPLYSPMSWGTARVAVGGGKVMLTMAANTEYDAAVSSRHQFHIYLRADAASGAPDFYSDAFGHSWDQRLIYDGSDFIATSIGDAALRGIGVAKPGTTSHRVAFAIKGGDSTTAAAYQNVFSRLGDLQVGESGYALLFSTEKSAEYTGSSQVVAARNLAFVHVRKDFASVKIPGDNKYDVAIVDTQSKNPSAQTFDVSIKDYWGSTFSGKNKGVVWLTDYASRDENVERPKLIAMGNGHFIAIWEKWNLTKYLETFAMVLDEYGQVLKPATSLGTNVRLHRQDSAVRLGNVAAWVIGEKQPARLVLYTIGEDLNVIRHEID